MRKTLTLAGMRAIDGRIRSVQRGTISIGSATSASATIVAVNTRHAVIRFLGFTNATFDARDMVGRVELTNSTTVTALRYSTVADSTTVSYEVTHYWPGVIKSIQRGTLTSGGGVNVTLTAVNLLFTDVDYLGYRFNDASPGTTYIAGYIALTTPTNLFSSNAAGATSDVGYQIVERWQ